MNEQDWVLVSEDYPQVAKGFTNVSINVICKTKKGRKLNGFYAYNQDTWFDENGNRINEVIAWQSK